MTAVTANDFYAEPVALDRRLARVEPLSGLARWAELISLPNDGLAIIADIRTCSHTCGNVEAIDKCLAQMIVRAKSISKRMTAVARRLPWFYAPIKRKWLFVADQWEEFAEDLALVENQEKRSAWDELSLITSQAAKHLPAWDGTDLFQ